MSAIENFDLQSHISASVVETFATMLTLEIQPIDVEPPAGSGVARMVGALNFAGNVSGIFNVQTTIDFGRLMASGLLGMEPEEVDPASDIRDLLAEITNIVGGNLKSALTDAGLRCALSSPSFTTGSDFMIESLNLERYERYAFQCEGRAVFVELGIKISDLVKTAVQTGKGIHYEVVDPQSDGGEKPQAQEKRAAPAASAQAPAEDTPPKPPAAPPPPAAPGTAEPTPAPEDFGLEILLDIPVELTVELGRTKIPIQDLLRLGPGAPVKLAKLEGEPVDILANDVLIARGEVVVRSEKYGIRITEITSRMDRLKGLR